MLILKNLFEEVLSLELLCTVPVWRNHSLFHDRSGTLSCLCSNKHRLYCESKADVLVKVFRGIIKTRIMFLSC